MKLSKKPTQLHCHNHRHSSNNHSLEFDWGIGNDNLPFKFYVNVSCTTWLNLFESVWIRTTCWKMVILFSQKISKMYKQKQTLYSPQNLPMSTLKTPTQLHCHNHKHSCNTHSLEFDWGIRNDNLPFIVYINVTWTTCLNVFESVWIKITC